MDPNSLRMSMSRRRSSIRSLFHSSSSAAIDQGSNDSFQENESETTVSISKRRLSFRRGKRFDLAEEEEMDDAFLSGSASIGNPTTSAFFGRWRESREIYREDYSRSVEVAEQAMWCTCFWSIE